MSQYNYCEIVDKALGHSNSIHRTLRSCLDPGSNEWSETSMDKRIEVLTKVVNKGNDLQTVLLHYKMSYQEMNKPHVVDNLNNGLAELLEYLLTKSELK